MSYMKNEKFKLTKPKKSSAQRKKLYEARQVNRKFQQDPGSVCSCIGKCLKSNKKTRTKGGSLKKKKKRANSGEHYVKEPEVEILKWNGLRMLERD